MAVMIVEIEREYEIIKRWTPSGCGITAMNLARELGWIRTSIDRVEFLVLIESSSFKSEF